MITTKFMKSPKWQTNVSNRIFITIGAADESRSEDDKLSQAIEFYTHDPKRHLDYLGNLLIARSNIIFYGGGDSSQLQVTQMAHLLLVNGELAEVNMQLDAITLFELDIIDELEDQDVRAQWIDAVDYLEYLISLMSADDPIPTESQMGDKFLSILLGPFLLPKSHENYTLH